MIMFISMLLLPITKKFAGRAFSFRLLYVKSRTSSWGKAPNPRGRLYKRFILKERKGYIWFNMQGIAQNLLSQILLLDEDDQYEHFFGLFKQYRVKIFGIYFFYWTLTVTIPYLEPALNHLWDPLIPFLGFLNHLTLQFQSYNDVLTQHSIFSVSAEH